MKSYIKDIKRRDVEGLLGYKINQIYKVPDYQRPFSWNKSTAEVFISDLFDKFNNKEELFAGTLIFVENEHILEIVDGQQRFMNLTIIFAVVRDFFVELGERDLVDDINKYIYMKKPLKEEIEFKLISEESNRDFFIKFIQNPTIKLNSQSRILNDFDFEMFSQNKKHYLGLRKEHRSIFDAYKTYNQFLFKVMSGLERNDKITFLKEFLSKAIFKINFAEIIVSDDSMADEIFESINSKREELNKADLIKNKILGSIRKNLNNEALVEAKHNWSEITELAEAANLDTKTFIRYYWLSEYGMVTDRTLFNTIKNEFEKNYFEKNSISYSDIQVANNYSEFLKLLENCAADLDNMRNASLDKIQSDYNVDRTEGMELIRSFNILNSIKATIWQVLFFSILRNKRELKYKGNVRKFLDMFTKYTFLYFTVLNRPGNWYTNRMIKYSKSIDEYCDKSLLENKNYNKEIADEWKKLFVDFSSEFEKPTEEEFAREFTEKIIYKDRPQARQTLRYVLGTIEKELGGNFNPENIEVEHIVPVDSNPHWKLSKKITRPFVNNIGNLLILTKKNNQRASNFDFSTKMEVYSSSTLKLVNTGSDLSFYDNNISKKWSFNTEDPKLLESQINKRGSELISFAYKIWVEDVYCYMNS